MKALAALSQFVNKTFALWVLVFAAIAYAAPDPFKPLAGWISPLLGLVMFGMGLTLSVNDFKLVLSKPMDVLIGILAQFIIMPTLAYLLCIVLQLPAEIAGVSGAAAVPLRNPAGEEEQIRRALSMAGGNKSQAAKLLGIDRKTLYNKLHLYGIE